MSRHPAFSQMTVERLASFCAAILASLRKGAFWDPARWSKAVVVMRATSTTVTSRADFAGFLAGADLPKLAKECVTRKVPKGDVLVFLDLDVPEVVATGFIVVPVADGLRAVGVRV